MVSAGRGLGGRRAGNPGLTIPFPGVIVETGCALCATEQDNPATRCIVGESVTPTGWR